MDWQSFYQNWALYAAVVPAAIVLSAIIGAIWRKSTHGELHQKIAVYRSDRKRFERARKVHNRAADRLRKMQSRADHVKPRLLQEAKESVADAAALVRIADDKMQVSANILRKFIFEEYPPRRHERMRARLLPGDVADDRPFSF